ncbi:Hypothetical protein R9X50_00281100 [Acrodontium crateriforme]|uniref:Uncharacterized protein n=1 Tax=Acrodontium crateriforme TaxID=150365 RepID=A0AAQ3M290_9PEZI|nr:Hypothetical protein R9X50_00281100 [Acrodontium crateriforme]
MTTVALTATFTPPADCLSKYYKYGSNQLVGPQTASCYPPGWSSTTTTFYSPGVCPAGYVTACSNVATASSITETHATCCPVNYQCQNGGLATTALMCNSLIGAQTFTYTIFDEAANTVQTVETGGLGGYMNAYGVSLRYQAKDLEMTVTETASVSASATSAVASTSGTSQSGGLSTGAKAGIGVGVALGCILLVTLGVFFLMRRRKRGPSADDVATAQPALGRNDIELLHHDPEPEELHTDGKRDHKFGLSEAPSDRPVGELDSGPEPRHELQ